MSKYTLKQFQTAYPNDDACLHQIFILRYGHLVSCPKCQKEPAFVKVKDRRSYQCPYCSYQVYPTVGTIFEKSTTPLTSWFMAIYLHCSTRNGVAAKELERVLSVCYKTALRMAHQIKIMMVETDFGQLMGEVMIDETYIGMLGKNMHRDRKKILLPKDANGNKKSNKIGVMGMMGKDGKIITKVLGVETHPDDTLKDIVIGNVHPDSVVVTDAYPPYKNLKKHFNKHVRVDHEKDEYVKDGFTTNNVENYWSTLKRMIKGTHIHVSKKHLSKYVAENTFRYLRRNQPEKMFEKILEKMKDNDY